MRNTLFREKIVNALLYVYNNNKSNVSRVAKNTGLSYSYACKLVRQLSSYRIFIMEKVNRNVLVSLTEKGRNIAFNFDAIYKIIQ